MSTVIVHKIPRNMRSLLARRKLGITASREGLWASSSLNRTFRRLFLVIFIIITY